MGSPNPAAMMKYTRVLMMMAGSTRLSRLRAARLPITITDLVTRTPTPATRLQGDNEDIFSRGKDNFHLAR